MSEVFDTAEFYNESKIPASTMETITNYIHKGVPPGSFVMAVLENNLKKTYAQADEHNLVAIPAIVQYLYNNAPGNCWGSPKVVRDWLAMRGMEGLTKPRYHLVDDDRDCCKGD